MYDRNKIQYESFLCVKHYPRDNLYFRKVLNITKLMLSIEFLLAYKLVTAPI